MATQDLTPKHFKIIPSKDKIEVFDIESDPSLGLGAQIGGLGGRSARTVSEAINNEGNLVTNIVNARLNTSAKTILSDFTFGESGALKMITDENNGLWISPTGILAKKSGENTLTVTNAGDVTMAGTITAIAGAVGGWNISATALYYDGATDNVSAGMASADYPFYAGKKYADRATAPFRVTPAGEIYASAGTIEGNLTVGGRLATTIGGAINIDGNFINNVINANLDTSAKTILGDFTFGESGAIKMITDADNGLWISPAGILGKKAGENTFTITDGGDATFAGTLSATSGTLGTLEIATGGHIRGGQTAYNTGVGFFLGYSTDTYKFSIGNPDTQNLTWDGTNLAISNMQMVITASDALRQSNNTEKTTTAANYTKVKEIKVNVSSETLTTIKIKFDMKSQAAGATAMGKIYKNGNAIGTERITNEETYQTYSEDLGPFVKDDLIQIYANNNIGLKTYIANFRLYYDKTFQVPTDFTNQDPA